MNAREHMGIMHDMPCMVCGCSPVATHHVMGGSVAEKLGPRGRKKHSDWLVLSLCHDHHQGQHGIHTIGVLCWEAAFGTQVEMIDAMGKANNLDLWALAKDEAAHARVMRKYIKPKKILGRLWLRGPIK